MFVINIDLFLRKQILHNISPTYIKIEQFSLNNQYAKISISNGLMCNIICNTCSKFVLNDFSTVKR